MGRKNRAVEDRQESLRPSPGKKNFTLAGVKDMYGLGWQGEEFPCTIVGHCRTRVFEFPRSFLREQVPGSPYHTIYDSPPILANIVSDLGRYFAEVIKNRHYAISPSLEYEVIETDKKIRSQRTDGTLPVFVVIQEYNELTPIRMEKGECCISDEVLCSPDKTTTILQGGVEGRKFITAWDTTDGEWPDVPNNQHQVNMILASVRVEQAATGPIRKYLDQGCLVTDEGRFVAMMRPTASARGETVMGLDGKMCSDKAVRIRRAISRIEEHLVIPHVALLVNAMYRDDHKDDSYQRLLYLRLWQSLAEAGSKHLGYPGDIKSDAAVVAGEKTLAELRDYRDDVAHWWTATIDERFLFDLQATINELMRRTYFVG